MTAGDAALRERLLPVPRGWPPTTLRRAAVLAPLFASAGEDRLLFLVRRHDLREHAGQIAFPGGADAGDADPVQCALREAHEEIGLPGSAVTLLGELQPRQSSSGYRVHCLVARVVLPEPLVVDPGEVARVLTVPLRELCLPGRWRWAAPAADPPLPPSPHFEVGADVIWGLTGRFAHDLVQALRGEAPA